MPEFEFHELELKGAYLIHNFFAGDSRGGFTKSFEKDMFLEAGIEFALNETFVSVSMRNVIRGLHFQLNEPQAKLISVAYGSVWDVIVDLRKGSGTFRQWRAFELDAENHFGLYVPRGFAHGFASMADNTVMLYQCCGRYDKETDTGLRYDIPEIGITWPVEEKDAIHSDRDLKLMNWSEYVSSLPLDKENIFGDA